MPIIQLKTICSVKKGKALELEIQKVIQKAKNKINFRGLGKGRPVFLNKYIQGTDRPDKTRRRQRFLPALELLKKVKIEDITNRLKEPTGEWSFEFKGITPNEKMVGVHIREIIKQKDKRLYLISTF